MEREIKFRGKTSEGKWIYGDVVHRDNRTYIFNEDGFDSYDRYEVDLETVGQYTGLKDKNGVEVYEGDIIRVEEYRNNAISIFTRSEIEQFSYDDVKGELGEAKTYDGYNPTSISAVKWEDGSFLYSDSKMCDTMLSVCFGDQRFSSPIFEVEVIGNIFDNTELIK